MLFGFFKKKDKVVSKEFKQPKHFEHKPFSRHIDKSKITPPNIKDSAQINSSEEGRIGKLGEVILQYNMISREDLEKALNVQKESAKTKRKMLGEILLEHKFLTEDQLLSAFARHCRIPYIQINKYGLPREAIKALPRELVVKHKVLPVDKIGTVLMIAVVDPYDTKAIEEIKEKTGLKIKTVLCKQSEFMEMVKFYYHDNQNVSEEVKTVTDGDNTTKLPTEEQAVEAPETVTAEPIEDLKETQDSDILQDISTNDSAIAVEELHLPNPPSSEKETKPAQIFEPEPGEAIESNSANQQEIGIESEVPEVKAEAEIESQCITDQAIVQPVEIAQNNIQETDSNNELEIEEAITPTDSSAEIKQPSEENPEDPVKAEASKSGYSEGDTRLTTIEEPEAPPDDLIEIIEEDSSLQTPDAFYPNDEKIQQPEPEIPQENQVEVSSADSVGQPADEVSATVDSEGEEVELPEYIDKKRTEEYAESGEKAVLSSSSEKEDLPQHPIAITEDEFNKAEQLFSMHVPYTWEKLYHCGKLSHAEKVDENEFLFYAESSLKVEERNKTTAPIK